MIEEHTTAFEKIRKVSRKKKKKSQDFFKVVRIHAKWFIEIPLSKCFQETREAELLFKCEKALDRCAQSTGKKYAFELSSQLDQNWVFSADQDTNWLCRLLVTTFPRHNACLVRVHVTNGWDMSPLLFIYFFNRLYKRADVMAPRTKVIQRAEQWSQGKLDTL